ncbi:hypothetical protein GXW82_43960 [Streptacidiphilus sp. 4-A2]|nr:hypothetical protein [Streptacidiphilus sp. 4-A2]
MRMRNLAVAAAVLTLAAAGAPGAWAVPGPGGAGNQPLASRPVLGAAPGASRVTVDAVKPHTVIGCGLGVEAPYHVSGTKYLYATAGTGDCTSPPPTLCEVTVDIQYYDPNQLGGVWINGNESTSGQKPCVGLTATTRYNCIEVEKRLWRTYATLEVEGAAYTVNYSLYQDQWC